MHWRQNDLCWVGRKQWWVSQPMPTMPTAAQMNNKSQTGAPHHFLISFKPEMCGVEHFPAGRDKAKNQLICTVSLTALTTPVTDFPL